MTTTVMTPRTYSIAPLSATNYLSWSIKLEMLLIRSELWSVVDGSEGAPTDTNIDALAAWKSRDSKARSEILLHCGEKQLLMLKPLSTSKVVWDKLKQLYERSNKASQVNLHKQLCHLSMTDNDDVINFLEHWQSVLQEAAIAGCQFDDTQQVMLLLSALPDSWSAFITTQGGISTLTFTELISNILQQNAINNSNTESSKTSAFYVKGKFFKPQHKFNRSQQQGSILGKPPIQQFRRPTSSTSLPKNPIFCHYCGKPGHKSPECRKKKRNFSNSKSYLNSASASSDDQVYMFTAILPESSMTTSNSWYLDSGASQHMSPIYSLFRDYHVLSTSKTILLGDNSTYQALGIGSVLLQLTTGQHFLIKDVLYVPGLAKNLLSVAQITSTGNTTITFTQDHCVINTISPKSSQPMLFRIPKHGNLFSLGTGIDPITQSYSSTVTQNDHDAIKWHYDSVILITDTWEPCKLKTWSSVCQLFNHLRHCVLPAL